MKTVLNIFKKLKSEKKNISRAVKNTKSRFGVISTNLKFSQFMSCQFSKVWEITQQPFKKNRWSLFAVDGRHVIR